MPRTSRPPWQPEGAASEPRTFRLGRFGRGKGDPSGAPGRADDETVTAVPLPPQVGHLGDRPPTYEAEPTALPAADPDALRDLVADTVLDGARYGASTLRAVSTRGDSARYRGEHRRDALLTARFGTGQQALVLIAVATGARAAAGAHRAAAEATRRMARAVGRNHARLAADIRAGSRGDLKSGLHRLTDRSLGTSRARSGDPDAAEEPVASLRCLLLPADPGCRVRVFFGAGEGGLFRLREGVWQDIEPRLTDTVGEPVVGFGSPPTDPASGPGKEPEAGPASSAEDTAAAASAPAGDDPLTVDLRISTPPSPYRPAPEPARDPFRFRASVARPGDALLLCSEGLAAPLRGEEALATHLAGRWVDGPPGLAAFLADTTVRVKGYADDRTAAAVWEA
ncbi:protein phosphatase 2C domain-containing protein [Streptomyces sp. NPDC005955]|uniref:protein phosphatase 2C domain-containing protein n=1 Tax=Streptomyces sp. NPDC005955 TaxID=3364738 RepID=UPI0036A20751